MIQFDQMIIRRPEGVVEDVAFPALSRFCQSLYPPKHPLPGDNLLLLLIFLLFIFSYMIVFFKHIKASFSSWRQFVTFDHFLSFIFLVIFSSNLPKHPLLSDNLLLLPTFCVIFLNIVFLVVGGCSSDADRIYDMKQLTWQKYKL